MAPARDPEPTRTSVRAYQVGFGDAILVSFSYEDALDDERDERHLLFDFGSSHGLRELGQSYGAIAEDIANRTKGVLDVLVITHRHKDHLDAFADETAAAKLAELKPRLVVRPWTDDPEAAADATAPGAPEEASRRFAASVHEAQEFSREVADTIESEHKLDRRTLRGELGLLALDEVANKEAIGRIDALAERRERGAPICPTPGSESGIGSLVAGSHRPRDRPTDARAVAGGGQGQRSDDPEYWIRQRVRLHRMLAFASDRPGVREGSQLAAETTGLASGSRPLARSNVCAISMRTRFFASFAASMTRSTTRA